MKTSLVAEMILSSLLNTRSKGLFSKIRYKSLSKARTILAQNEERLIRYELDGTDLLLPLSHQLPIFRNHYPGYSTNIGRIASCVTQKYPSATIIDVGANVGDTAAIIRAKSEAAILCIEGDAYFFKVLQSNVMNSGMRDVQAYFAFVGTESGELEGGLHHEHGTATYSTSVGHSTSQIPLSQILDNFVAFKHSKLLKIDTDGFDCQILAAELQWLSVARPVAFIEYDPYLTSAQGYDASQIFSKMTSVGYRVVVFWENTGDYLLIAELSDVALLDDIHRYCSRSSGRRYLDIAFVHEEDADLAWRIRESEREYSVQPASR